uniref:Epiregulin n=1 Tax=Pelusios castaneus TaxID=367368 RepID=A0A8C8RVB8_9SAUR
MDAPCRPTMRIRSALLSLVFYLLQAAFGTTVTPLCESNEMENCTTALIQTANSPRVAEDGIAACKPEMQDYCIHGECWYHVDLNEHLCRCDTGFSGARCVHSDLVRDTYTWYLSKEYLALTIILILFSLTAISIVAYFLYIWYQKENKRQANNREYKEVDVHEKNPTLLHV